MQLIVTGNVNVDVLMGSVSPWPQTGTEVHVGHYQLRVGGSLGNTALALAALEAKATYLANVGSDVLGSWLADELASRGCLLTQTPGETAMTVGLSHPDNQRTFFTHFGHFAAFDAGAVMEAVLAAEPGSCLLIGGYFLLPSLRQHALKIMEKARQQELSTLLDTGWPTEGWSPTIKEEIRGLLPYCDYFLPNLEEGGALTESQDVLAVLRTLDRYVNGRTIMKLGSEGAGYLEGDKLCLVRAPKAKVADTIGAGDAFNGGFLYALKQGRDWRAAASWAVHTASLAVATEPRRYPSQQEVARSLGAEAN